MLLCMSRTAPAILLTEQERTILDAWARSRSLPHRQVVRAQIVTRAAEGVASQDIARELGISRPTVQLWRERYLVPPPIVWTREKVKRRMFFCTPAAPPEACGS